MRFRVALITNSFEDYAGELARQLAVANEVLVVAPAGLEEPLTRRIGPDVELQTFAQHRMRNAAAGVRTARTIKQIVNQWAPDVVHHQLGGDPWMTLGLQLLAPRLPVVTTIHEARARFRDEDVWWAPLARQLAVRHSAEVIVLTDAVRRNLQPRAKHPRPVSVIELGRVAGGFPRSDDPPTFVADRRLLFFGRIRPYKGLEHLIRAAAEVSAEVDGFRLCVAGSGASADELFPGGTPPSWVELELGFVPDESVAPLFDRSRAVVLPYLEASQSGVAATALALGCPVITSDAGGLAEGVVDGENGLVVQAGTQASLVASMMAVLTDDELAGRLRAGALGTAGDTSRQWQEIVEQTMAVYRRVAHA